MKGGGWSAGRKRKCSTRRGREAREDKFWTLIYWRNDRNAEIKRDMKGLGSGSKLVSWTSPLTSER